jgi:hypothetical protein
VNGLGLFASTFDDVNEIGKMLTNDAQKFVETLGTISKGTKKEHAKTFLEADNLKRIKDKLDGSESSKIALRAVILFTTNLILDLNSELSDSAKGTIDELIPTMDELEMLSEKVFSLLWEIKNKLKKNKKLVEHNTKVPS